MSTRGMFGRDHLPWTSPDPDRRAGRAASRRPALLSSSSRSATDVGMPDDVNADNAVDAVTPAVARRPGSGVAFVFQGGGSQAACQVGTARALEALEALEALGTSLRRRHVASLTARGVAGS